MLEVKSASEAEVEVWPTLAALACCKKQEATLSTDAHVAFRMLPATTHWNEHLVSQPEGTSIFHL